MSCPELHTSYSLSHFFMCCLLESCPSQHYYRLDRKHACFLLGHARVVMVQ